MSLVRELFLKGSTSPWLARQMTNRRFVQQAVARFMPGEDLEDAVAAASSLRDSGRRSILTILGENVPDRAAAEGVAADYERLVEAIAAGGLSADLSVKPTHLGLDLGMDVAEAMLRTVVERAGSAGRLVAIDMESADYLEDTLELYRRLRSGRGLTGTSDLGSLRAPGSPFRCAGRTPSTRPRPDVRRNSGWFGSGLG